MMKDNPRRRLHKEIWKCIGMMYLVLGGRDAHLTASNCMSRHVEGDDRGGGLLWLRGTQWL